MKGHSYPHGKARLSPRLALKARNGTPGGGTMATAMGEFTGMLATSVLLAVAITETLAES
jgi:hypothetical protein